jgi:hypothetical protein
MAMRRREFITGLCGIAGVAASAKPALAVQRSSPARVGFISGYDEATARDFIAALRDGLAGYGYVEPRSLVLDLLFANFAPELTQRRPGSLSRAAERSRPFMNLALIL